MTRSEKLIAFYSGSGIGLAIGVLMGMAASPTVGVMIGALATILAVLLGLNDALFSNSKAIRVGSFGFAWVIGVCLGMFIRTHNLLSPSPQELYESFIKLDYTPEQVRAFIAYKEFGIVDKDWEMADLQIESQTTSAKGGEDDEDSGTETTTKMTGSLTRIQHSSSLFSADVALNSCAELEGLDELPITEIVNNFEFEKGSWAKLAGSASQGLNDVAAKSFLLAIREGICEQSEVNLKSSSCEDFNGLGQNVQYAAIKPAFTSSQGVWTSLATTIDNTTMTEADKARSLWITQTVLCENTHESNSN